MNKLEEARIKINEADSMMAKIFEQRFMAVKKVLEYKKVMNKFKKTPDLKREAGLNE